MARQAPWTPQTPQESAATPTPGAVALRPARSGDMGRVITHHADVYGAEYGFTGDFERYVLLGLAALAQGSNEREGLWIAERDGAFLGCVGVVEAEANAAQLRWLLVLPEARGLGLGRRLVECAVDFCRAQGYASILLWTLRALDAARGLYASSGFHLAEARNGTMGGRPHVEERWEMELVARTPRPDDGQP
jgi:GNAT superfamily N-acetyltransferase